MTVPSFWREPDQGRRHGRKGLSRLRESIGRIRHSPPPFGTLSVHVTKLQHLARLQRVTMQMIELLQLADFQ